MCDKVIQWMIQSPLLANSIDPDVLRMHTPGQRGYVTSELIYPDHQVFHYYMIHTLLLQYT